MAQWYVKQLSQLTQVSVQTLHHYDRIGLLKPSVRLENGYRLYSEKDLLKLQQIIALKFFGFELTQIKTLLSREVDLVEQLAAQSQYLQNKASTLLTASQTLKKIISDCSGDKSLPWETIIQSIEVYRMVQQFEKTWAGKIFTPEELQEYANFQQEVNARFTENEKKIITQGWQEIVSQARKNLDKDPKSELGIAIGKRCMDWVNAYYGKKYVKLRNVIWEQGLKKGKIDHEDSLSPEASAWLDKAISAYYRKRILAVLNQVGTQDDNILLKDWESLLMDMHGDVQDLNLELFKIIFADAEVSQTAKMWVKKYMESSHK